MSKSNVKKISVEISEDCWKKMKILSIHRGIPFYEQVKEILEKAVQSKKFEVEVADSNV